MPTKKTGIVKLNKKIRDILFNKQIVVTSLSVLAFVILNNFDVVFVKKFFSPHSAGIYSSWSLFAKIIYYFTGPIAMVSYIFFSSKKTESEHEKVLHGTLGLILLIAFVSFICYTYAPLLLIKIFFGEKFDTVSPYLTYASIFGSLYTTITVINNYFLAKKSRLSLILPILIPLYILLLFIIPRSLTTIISLNVYYCVFVTAVYFIAYVWSISYNLTHGKRKE